MIFPDKILYKENILFLIIKIDFPDKENTISRLMDTKIGIVTEQQEKGVYIAQFKVYDLAIFSYYVESNKQCYIIDPTFDYTVYKNFIEKRGSILKYVVLTHYHADFLSAHVDFKVAVIMGEGAKRQVNEFQLKQMKDGTKFKIGNIQTRVLSTPGHTTQSTCFILSNQEGKQFCIFTGDTVFLRQVGRPDLAVAANISSADLAGMLYDSVQKIKALDKNLRLYPGHGSGSACGKSIGSGNFCTLGAQHQKNYGFLIKDRKQFIEKLIFDLQAPPSYFFYDAKINQQGTKQPYVKILQKCKKPIQMKQLKNIVDRKVTIIDTRPVIKNGLIEGSYWMTAKGELSQWISMVLKPEQQFVVLTEIGKQQEIIERFLRIGYFNLLGYNAFDVQNWNLTKLFKIELRTYEELDKNKKYIHLDVRNAKEWQDIGTFEESLLISLTQLKQKIQEVKRFIAMNGNTELVVNCKTGIRARFAASILLKNGIIPIVLNQNLQKLKQKGFKMTQYKGSLANDQECCQIY